MKQGFDKDIQSIFKDKNGKYIKQIWWERNSNRLGSEGYKYEETTEEEYIRWQSADYGYTTKINEIKIKPIVKSEPLKGKDLFNGTLKLN